MSDQEKDEKETPHPRPIRWILGLAAVLSTGLTLCLTICQLVLAWWDVNKGLTPPGPGVIITQTDGQTSPVQPEYQRWMDRGSGALKKGEFAEAVKAFQAAHDLQPADPDAAKALQTAKVELQRQTDYQRCMDQGNGCLTRRTWSEAVTAFQAALVLYPGDSEATEALKRAKAEREASLRPPPPPVEVGREAEMHFDADVTTPYAEPGTNDPVNVGRLYNRQPVVVRESRGSRYRVEWQEGARTLSGWVDANYLKAKEGP